MQYQVIVLDLDGTLTNSKKEITEPTRQALIDIQKNRERQLFLPAAAPSTGLLHWQSNCVFRISEAICFPLTVQE